MPDLPPIGSRVRTTFGAEGVVEKHARSATWKWARRDGTGNERTEIAFVSWSLGGGMWVTADEIAEVLGKEVDDIG